MAQSLARCLSFSRGLRPTSCRLLRDLSTSSAVQARQRPSRSSVPGVGRRTQSVLEDDPEDIWDQVEEADEVDDSPTAGHILLQQQRQLLHYMRLIEHEMPKLVAYRKPFVPPSSDKPLIVRSMQYQGEGHPAAIKRVIVAPVDKLPLKDDKALHKFILLAGSRWTPNPPADAGVPWNEEWGSGYIKIACEDFPKPSMNLKWASDTLDKLIEEANNGKDTFEDVPIDIRHIIAKVRKAKKGDHRGNRLLNRPSIRDFPKEWLPTTFE
ncbi:mitochondrial ribosomal subunit protein-domain-containing protein [Gymnopilus junonius]|uniref:Mitochondrial ribosomal subunit protein-domain-containing protein n=1 Tax=Gymnopilus junonius TaxID=109634 RepID=A0A9P5TPT2_GYMJU|nr:mitochondrial ribosomal subunit protein-domain-containing protein [Gymnopilus junonius]